MIQHQRMFSKFQAFVLEPSWHTTLFQRPSSAHNVHLTLDGRWSNVVFCYRPIQTKKNPRIFIYNYWVCGLLLVLQNLVHYYFYTLCRLGSSHIRIKKRQKCIINLLATSSLQYFYFWCYRNQRELRKFTVRWRIVLVLFSFFCIFWFLTFIDF